MNTQQRAILSKARRLLATDAEWDESKHPRAENGRFGSGRPSENNLDERGKVNFPELSADEVETLAKMPIAIEKDMPVGARKKAIVHFLQQHLQGRSVRSSDGKAIQFNANDSVAHLSFNGRRNHLLAQIVPHIADVFATGEFIGRQEPNHERKDKSIVAFHIYRKWIELQAGYLAYVEVHAAERETGNFEYAAYAHKKIDSKSEKGSQNLHADDAANSIRKLEFGSTAFMTNPTPAADSAQEEYELFRIMKITDQNGRDVTKTLEFAAYTLKKAPASDGYSSTDIAENSTRIPDSPPDARAGVKDNRSGADNSASYAARHVEYGLSSADNHTPAQNQMQGCEYAAYAHKKIDSKSEKVGNAPASIETAKDSSQAAGFVSYADNHTPFAEDGQTHETAGYIRIIKITDQNGRDVTETYDEDRLSIAQDRSLRSYDQDGRLHVESSNISKATVNPYYGGEIPNYRQLGLEPKKVYYLLRDPEELKKAAPTFNNLPLLSKHIPVSADEPQKEVIAGTTGSDTVFEDGYLKCSLAVWDAEAIAGIESGEQVELSSAYHYTADMTAGEFEGRHYDGVMRDIVGNHVALVDVGRAGRDVVVSDADPFNKKENTMKLKAGAKARIQAAVQPLLAQDAELSPDELLQVIGSLTNEVQTAEDDGEDLPPENVENVGTDGDDSEDGENNPAPAEDEEPEKPAEDEEPEAPEGGAPKPAQDAAISKMAMDAAIQKAVAAERKRAQALAAAQREVAHIVGDVAMDNAADVYKFALEQSGIDVTGVHPSAYRAMVGMLGKPKQPMAQDAAKTAQQFPGLSRIRKA